MKNHPTKPSKLLFLAIVGIAAVMRLANLSSVPPSLSHDEVAIGYNAYSILKTGRDEYGTPWPLLFRSFDDYKLPGMVYATVLPITLLGPNDLSVRLPSATLGILTVVAFWYLVQELLTEGKKPQWQLTVPFITLLFALSPWHINFSRQSFESNGALFFVVAGTTFLVRSIRVPRSLWAAAIFYSISFYFYYSVRTVVPFAVALYTLCFGKHLRRHWLHALGAAILGAILISPMLPAMLSPGGLSRMKMVSVVNDPRYTERTERYIKFLAQSGNPLLRFVFNRHTALASTIVENYTKNLSPHHIFASGTGPMGLQYPLEAPFFLLGLVALFTLTTPLKYIFIGWLLTTPLVGAFSADQPNSLRTLLNAPMFSLLSGLGFVWLFNRLKNSLWKKVLLFGFLFALILSVSRFFFLYFVHSPRTNAASFADGHKQMTAYLTAHEGSFDTIYVSGYYWRPYIFVLFWKQYNPAAYQRGGTLWGFDKYRFTAAEWDREGVFVYDSDFNPKVLNVTNPDKTLFLLAGPEFRQHQEKFDKIDTVDGRFAKEVFVAARLHQ